MQRCWDECFRAEDRARFGTTMQEAVQTHGEPFTMWAQLRGVTLSRAVIELSERLGWIQSSEADWLLREGGELPQSDEEAQSEAIARGDLVVIRSEGSVFWRGENLDLEWGNHSRVWEFFLTACESAKANQEIDAMSLSSGASHNVVANLKYRLKQIPHMPIELMEYFEPGSGTGAQRFSMPAEQIHLFDE